MAEVQKLARDLVPGDVVKRSIGIGDSYATVASVHVMWVQPDPYSEPVPDSVLIEFEGGETEQVPYDATVTVVTPEVTVTAISVTLSLSDGTQRAISIGDVFNAN